MVFLKIAIITLHRVYNYGSALQAYATQKIFEKNGCEVIVIDYVTEQRTKGKIFKGTKGKNISAIKKPFYYLAKAFSILLKERTFGKFVKNNLNLTKKYITAEDLEKDPPIADIYVTGSDQTWNSDYNEGVDRGFFLDFLPEQAKRISFVASFGKKELDEKEIDTTKKFINRYSALSVREDSALNILNNLGRNDAIQLIDPTLQIDKNDWLSIASKRLIKKPYLILMLLYNEDNHATEYARKIADEKGLELVKICWDLNCPPMVDKLMTHRQPSDFLSLFYYADFVVTNSFHGLAFSVNLEKQFIVVPRNEYNSRIESLLDLLNIKDRMVSSMEDALKISKEQIDYEKIKPILIEERKKAEDFIKENIR